MDLSLLKHNLISTFGTDSLPLQKVVTNADKVARKKMQKEDSYERNICPLWFYFFFFEYFQRTQLSFSVNATKQKMLNSSSIMSKSRDRLGQQDQFSLTCP